MFLWDEWTDGVVLAIWLVGSAKRSSVRFRYILVIATAGATPYRLSTVAQITLGMIMGPLAGWVFQDKHWWFQEAPG